MPAEGSKAIAGRWFTEFWGPRYNPDVIDELAAADIRFGPSWTRGRGSQVRRPAGACHLFNLRKEMALPIVETPGSPDGGCVRCETFVIVIVVG